MGPGRHIERGMIAGRAGEFETAIVAGVGPAVPGLFAGFGGSSLESH